MSRYLASFPMASSTSWKKTNHQKNQQKATTDPTATARRSVADWKNSTGPKLEGQPRRSAAERKPKTSLFGTDSLQCSALGIHDHAQNRPRSTRFARAVGRGAPRPHRFRRMAPPLKHGRVDEGGLTSG